MRWSKALRSGRRSWRPRSSGHDIGRHGGCPIDQCPWVCGSAIYAAANGAPRLRQSFDGDGVMMDGMMNMGAMHWGMGLVGLLIIGFLVLGIAALVKYLFF